MYYGASGVYSSRRFEIVLQLTCPQKSDHDSFLRSAHDLFNDTVALAEADPLVNRFDERALIQDGQSLMELARLDASNLPLEYLNMKRLESWRVVWI